MLLISVYGNIKTLFKIKKTELMYSWVPDATAMIGADPSHLTP